MTQPLAEFSDYTASSPAEMRAVLRSLIKASGMSYNKVDELAGLPAGYTGKLLCEPPVRNIGPTSFFPLIWALACKVAFVPDPAARRKIEAHHMFETRDERKARGDDHWRNAKTLSMITEKAKTWGSAGGKARIHKLSKRQRTKIARLAANARWRALRRRKRLALVSADAAANLASLSTSDLRVHRDGRTST